MMLTGSYEHNSEAGKRKAHDLKCKGKGLIYGLCYSHASNECLISIVKSNLMLQLR